MRDLPGWTDVPLPLDWPDPAPIAPPGYLDALGGMPLLPAARLALLAAEDKAWADPARLHHDGRVADAILNASRTSLQHSLGVARLHLASSAASALAMTIGQLTARRVREGARPRILVGAVESYAALRGARAVPGAEVVEIPVDAMGRVDLEAFAHECTPDTALAVVQLANAELGTLQPLADVAAITRAHKVPLVSDAMACVARIPLAGPWDVLVAGAHDWAGPAGAAFVAVGENLTWSPPTAPDRGWIGGFPNVPAAAGAATAMEYLQPWWPAEAARHRAIITAVRTYLAGELSGVQPLGDANDRLPHVLTLLVEGVAAEQLVGTLAEQGVAVASGSACTADAAARSHVVEALGFSAPATVRLSLPWNCTTDTVERFVDLFVEYVRRER